LAPTNTIGSSRRANGDHCRHDQRPSIRLVQTRFGLLYAVGGPDRAFVTSRKQKHSRIRWCPGLTGADPESQVGGERLAMSKSLKTAAQLVALLNAELGKQDACVGVSVDGITPGHRRKGRLHLDGHRPSPFWWSRAGTMLTFLRRSGAPASTAVRFGVRRGFIDARGRTPNVITIVFP
jgi:hypothetical protein